MPTDVSEKQLETILVEYLRDVQGYECQSKEQVLK